MKKLAFVGAGSHADAVRPFIDTSEYTLVGFFDDKPIDTHDGLPILGHTSEVGKALDDGVIDSVFITVGDNQKRAEWFNDVAEHHYDALINIVSPTAIVLSQKSIQGRGIFIGSGAFVGKYVSIHDDVILNTYSVVEHHSQVHAHVNMTPRSVIAGFVEIGQGAYMGLNSSVIQVISIAPWTVVGAGAVVVQTINESGTYVGVPAKKVK
ncbi:NeuD/PglB/VioB family sugar acetyltransferase [Weissella confusa]|uniref:NeuD/PglB/VioB family sugar acetyltransferase n=1 Tax=Weissella confusa TaxID=1583 RepID=UPI00107F52BA|nr:NeuD/PglB/VioB family sugar acetyltransferase [Weissella confusa]MBJ7658596.1 NeuD protein [Weissella confusa]TGE64182.1 NeuD protein [Weissella confusa]